MTDPLPLSIQPAEARDTPIYIRLRGQTRENAIPAERLRALGITAESWAEDMRSGLLTGVVCRSAEQIVGYCFGDTAAGEVVVLAVLPDFEGQGWGRRLLDSVVAELRRHGHRRLFLGCAADPAVRSHGFYRHLGWKSTGAVDRLGDEVLELGSGVDGEAR
jgi:GNAT superfamily N-acetyltransferase